MKNRNAAVDGFAALGDSTRRQLFERIADRARPVGELARGLKVSRPAVSQHLKVLKRAGLVREVAEGTRRIYYIDPRGVAAMREWLESHWVTALSAFQGFANHIHEKESKP